jgi:LmbE family N-acetylglucosaminyl deacetylase
MIAADFSVEKPARVLCIVAHQDDFEFNAGGTFSRLAELYGDAVRIKVINVSTGASGHHKLDPDETFHRRMQEARASAGMIGASAECLSQLDGTHVAGQVLVSRNLLGGLWNAIRSFRADFLFCPPVASDPLAGVHIDHEETARAVRLVAYQLGVERAYPVVADCAGGCYRSPLIILLDDVYQGNNRWSVANDISNMFEKKVRMSACHATQVFEWLPVHQGRPAPSREEFATSFRVRHSRINARYDFDDASPREYFQISRWGRGVLPGELEWLFPGALIANNQ